MEISTLKIIVDFGLVVLIWMIQLVVYPSFKFINEQSLLMWHKKYTKGISVIVVPLMLGQLLLSVMLLLQAFSFSRILDSILVIIVWMITFRVFVPLHKTIADGKSDIINLEQLSFKNWYRTVIWSVIFMLNLILHLF